MLQLEDVLLSQGLGRPPGSLDQGIVEIDQHRLDAVLAERLVALGQDLFRRRIENLLDHAGRQMNTAKLGSLAELVD